MNILEFFESIDQFLENWSLNIIKYSDNVHTAYLSIYLNLQFSKNCNVLQFSVQRFAPILPALPLFHIFYIILNGNSFILLSNYLLLLYRHTLDFCILISYTENFTNSLELFADALGFSK